MRFLAILIIIINLLLPCVALADSGRAEYPAVFSHEDVRITSEQTIGRLMVADGQVYIDGKVTNGIIVIDGDVVIGSQAMIDGFILILGGNLSAGTGTIPAHTWIVPPTFRPMADWVVGGLLLAVMLVIIGVPAVIWLFFYLVRDTSVYIWTKKVFLKIQHQWSLLYLLAGLFVSGLMLAAFFEIAWETIFRSEMEAFDMGVIWLVRYKASADLDKFMVFITNLGYGYPYIAVVTVTFLTTAIYRRWREFSILAVCLSGGALLNALLKILFARSRPDLLRVVEATGYSFPSGHAMVSLCFYGMLAYLVIRNIKSWRIRYLVIVFTVLLVMAIGISRIYLGVHYPTDVIAGYAAGSMWLAISISLLIWWERSSAKRLNS